MLFDVFGRRVSVERTGDRWLVHYVSDEGKRTLTDDLVVPPEIEEDRMAQWLFDLCHEWSTARNCKVSRLK